MAGAAAAGDHQLLLGGDCSIVDMVNGGYGASGEYAADVDGGFTFWRAAGAEYKGDGSIFYRLDLPDFDPAEQWFIFELEEDAPYAFYFMGEFGDGAGTISFFQAEKLAKGVYAYDMKALAGEKYAKEKGMFHLYFWSGEAQNSPDVKVRISGMYLSRDGKLDKGEPAEGRKLALTEENTAAMKDTEIELQADGGMLLRVQKPLRFAENVTAVATVTLREFDLSKTPYLFIDYQAPSMRVGAGGAETLGVYFQTYAADGTNLGDVMPPSGGGRYSPNGSALRFDLSGVKNKLDSNPGGYFVVVLNQSNRGQEGKDGAVRGVYLGDCRYAGADSPPPVEPIVTTTTAVEPADATNAGSESATTAAAPSSTTAPDGNAQGGVLPVWAIAVIIAVVLVAAGAGVLVYLLIVKKKKAS